MEQSAPRETYIVAIDGEPVFTTQDSGEWMDYLYNLGVRTEGFRAGLTHLDNGRDTTDSVIEWFIR